MEKTIEIKGVDLAQLIGPADANLKMVEDAFSSQIIVRGSKIKIIGDKSLSKRDFSRVVNPLKNFGINIKSNNGFLPVKTGPISNKD